MNNRWMVNLSYIRIEYSEQEHELASSFYCDCSSRIWIIFARDPCKDLKCCCTNRANFRKYRKTISECRCYRRCWCPWNRIWLQRHGDYSTTIRIGGFLFQAYRRCCLTNQCNCTGDSASSIQNDICDTLKFTHSAIVNWSAKQITRWTFVVVFDFRCHETTRHQFVEHRKYLAMIRRKMICYRSNMLMALPPTTNFLWMNAIAFRLAHRLDMKQKLHRRHTII